MYRKTIFLSLLAVLIFGITDTVSALDLNTQAQNDVIDNFLKQLITGIFFISFAGVAGLVAWLYPRVTGKKAESAEIKGSDLVVASRLRRLTNLSVDFLIVINAIITAISYYAITIEWYVPFENWLLFSLGTAILYYWIFEGFFGRTIGKLLTGTKVVADDGSRANAFAILGRTLIRLIPFEAFSFLGTNNSGWHDRWSKTAVVKAARYKIKSGNKQNVLSEGESEGRRVMAGKPLIARSEELNGRWWYRLMKVIYGAVFLAGVAMVVVRINNQYKPREILDVSRSFIKCSNNKIYTSTDLGVSDQGSEISRAWDWLDVLNDEKRLAGLCAIGIIEESQFSPEQLAQVNALTKKNYEVVEPYKTEGSWVRVVLFSIGLIGLMAVFFWIVSKLFFFVYKGDTKLLDHK